MVVGAEDSDSRLVAAGSGWVGRSSSISSSIVLCVAAERGFVEPTSKLAISPRRLRRAFWRVLCLSSVFVATLSAAYFAPGTEDRIDASSSSSPMSSSSSSPESKGLLPGFFSESSPESKGLAGAGFALSPVSRWRQPAKAPGSSAGSSRGWWRTRQNQCCRCACRRRSCPCSERRCHRP